MQTYEIPRDKWSTDVTRFGEDHHRWLVSVEVLGSEIGAQPEVRNLPLEGLSAEPAAKGGSVSVFVESDIDDHLTHLIQRPTRIVVDEGDNGKAAMEIVSADGTSTIVNFLRPPL
ncbi:MAG: hypothetical protein EHM55_02615 [Acidobacteria bacterium]|nr:MAG: hypothetical protein EHM55_02615 [Acidobacteriota bacterium]